jgi:sodium transport system permease protein
MGRVLKGEALPMVDLMPSLLVCGVLTALAVAYVARVLRSAALK